MERPTGIEDALRIVGELLAVRLHRVVHQHLGIAHDGRCRRAQFLRHVGDERPFRSGIGPLVIRSAVIPTSGSVRQPL